MWTSNLSAAEIIEQKKLVQVSDHNAIEKIIDDVLNANPNQVSEFKSGKNKVIGFLIGAIMKVSRGQANPDIVNELLKKKLDNL